MKCANGCGRNVDALHMSDEGYCPDCFDRIIDIIVSEGNKDPTQMNKTVVEAA